MSNPYFIQLIGIFMILAGVVALSVVSYLYGTPLSYDEKRRMENREMLIGCRSTLKPLPLSRLSWVGLVFFRGLASNCVPFSRTGSPA